MPAMPMMPTPPPVILLTRPLSAAEGFVELLRQAGVDNEVLLSPVLRIERQAGEEIDPFCGAVFTSRNAVTCVEGRDLPCWCVGDATAAVAHARGWRAVSAGGDVEALYRRILADAPQGPLMHFRGAHTRGNLAERLTQAGIETGEVVIYRQEASRLSEEAKSLLARGNPVVLPLFSPRSAAQVVSEGPFAASLIVVAISEAVAQEAQALQPVKVMLCDAPNAGSMVAAIKHCASAACRIESSDDSA